MKIHALILAGGAGSRLGGVDKARLRIGNVALIDRVIDRLGEVSSLLVATGPEMPHALPKGIAIPDHSDKHLGPMAGVAAALRHLRPLAGPDDILASVAVDTPFLPSDFLARIVQPISDGAAASLAVWKEQFYPTNAAFRLSEVPEILPDSPKALLASMGAVKIDWSVDQALNPFGNVNTLADLVAMSRRAQSVEE
ncbi:MAG: molybdenum cofactor guanylyltransferase [Phyllobacteriaceae bacterium]|nr:molybdenum cofactor guanylyltransferase [Phyllobacteriaceae bacterium]